MRNHQRGSIFVWIRFAMHAKWSTDESECISSSNIRFQDFSDLRFPMMAPFWEGTVRRIGPRWTRKKNHKNMIFTPNESRVPALHVGMRITLWECPEQKLQAFEHFSVTKYVRIPGYPNQFETVSFERPESGLWVPLTGTWEKINGKCNVSNNLHPRLGPVGVIISCVQSRILSLLSRFRHR